MHCNLKQPDAAQPIHFNTSPVAGLKSLSLFIAVLERIYCWYVTLCCDLELWPRDLDLWPLTLSLNSVSCTLIVYRLWLDETRRNLREIRQSAAELLRFEIWPYDLGTRITCSAMLWDSLHKTLNSVKLSVHEMWPFFHANTSYHAMTLTFDPLTLKVCVDLVSRVDSLY